MLGTLINIYTFFASNANLDNYVYKGLSSSDNDLDRWLVSRVNSTVSNGLWRSSGAFLAPFFISSSIEPIAFMCLLLHDHTGRGVPQYLLMK